LRARIPDHVPSRLGHAKIVAELFGTLAAAHAPPTASKLAPACR
jgi:hypothetical protein